MKPLSRAKRGKSWIFQHGYRVVERNAPDRIWFVCKYCHTRKVIDAGGAGLFDVTRATSSAAAHLGQRKVGHNLTKTGQRQELDLAGSQGQLSLRQAFSTGVKMSQSAANALGHFDVHQFRTAAVLWLVDNNHPLRELSTPAFREMIKFANPEAEAALWTSHVSVTTFAVSLFKFMQPQVVRALSTAASKIHISFDGWTTKGGKRGFFGVVAHFANNSGVIQDLPIGLPELTGAHIGTAIAAAITTTLQTYGITSDRLGYFVLDNAANNDTAVAALAT
tara:strand:+ start:1419 stop:2252 length:834 start_codon:yes stop_codon:yes gene_type:complete